MRLHQVHEQPGWWEEFGFRGMKPANQTVAERCRSRVAVRPPPNVIGSPSKWCAARGR